MVLVTLTSCSSFTTTLKLSSRSSWATACPMPLVPPMIQAFSIASPVKYLPHHPAGPFISHKICNPRQVNLLIIRLVAYKGGQPERPGLFKHFWKVIQDSQDVAGRYYLDQFPILVRAVDNVIPLDVVTPEPVPGIWVGAVVSHVGPRRAEPHFRTFMAQIPRKVRRTLEDGHAPSHTTLAIRELDLAIGCLAHAKVLVERHFVRHQ